jgi:hypothetical protein
MIGLCLASLLISAVPRWETWIDLELEEFGVTGWYGSIWS